MKCKRKDVLFINSDYMHGIRDLKRLYTDILKARVLYQSNVEYIRDHYIPLVLSFHQQAFDNSKTKPKTIRYRKRQCDLLLSIQTILKVAHKTKRILNQEEEDILHSHYDVEV